MVALLLAGLAVAQEPQVSATVDRNTALVGDVLVLTIRVEARGDQPVEIIDPAAPGFELRDVQQRASVTIRDGTPARVTTRELALSALRPGRLTIGPVTVTQGETTVTTRPISVTVTAPGGEIVANLPRRVRDVLRERPPPELSPEEVTVSLWLSADSVVLGEQVDLFLVAWFPRKIRSRLRNPPTMGPPDVRGAWVYHQAIPHGVALSREVTGTWYDLYVLHDVLFPLTEASVEVGAATVSYTVPLEYSFLSREVRHEVQSRGARIDVTPQPARGRPADFAGAAGSGLEFVVEAPGGEVPLGGAVTLRAEVTGRGNVALWPEPRFQWPPSLRVYPEDVEVSIEAPDGRVGGRKVFRYLLVADSAGTHRIPSPSYPYFDVAAGRYETLRSPAVALVTPGGTAPVVTGTRPPSLMAGEGPPPTVGLVAAMPAWGWILLVMGPPLVVLGVRGWGRLGKRRRRPALARRPTQSTLDGLEREFRGVLERLVPDAALREGDGLANALRAAGVEAPVAGHVARVRDRLRQALFGPGGTSDPDELRAEVEEVLKALVGEPAVSGRGGLGAAVALALCLIPGSLMAQSPERLYVTGAVRPAVDSFALRAAAQPNVAAHWHNLGAALYRLGERGRARAAWLRAARLAPRARVIRDGLARTVPSEGASSALEWIAPLTPFEALAGAALCWLLGWGVLALGRWRPLGRGMLLLTVALALYGGYVWRRYERPTAVVLRAGTPLRVAPYGPAPADQRLDAGSLVLIERRDGPWRLVARDGRRGWLLSRELTPI